MMVKMMMRGRGAISEESGLGRLAPGPSPGESSGEELLTLCYTNLLRRMLAMLTMMMIMMMMIRIMMMLYIYSALDFVDT